MTPESRRHWRPPWYCWCRSPSSRCAASTRWSRSGWCGPATGCRVYIISLCIGTAIFGMFFFLTIFVQIVWGYSPLKTGLSYLPMVAMIMLASALGSQLGVADRRAAADGGPCLLIATGGLFWLSRLTEHSTYTGGLLGPIMVTGLGDGADLPAAVAGGAGARAEQRRRRRVVAAEHGPAGRRGDRARGARHGGVERGDKPTCARRPAAAAGARARPRTCRLPPRRRRRQPCTNHALAYGFSKGFVVSAGIALLALVIALVIDPDQARGPGRDRPDGGARGLRVRFGKVAG